MKTILALEALEHRDLLAADLLAMSAASTTAFGQPEAATTHVVSQPVRPAEFHTGDLLPANVDRVFGGPPPNGIIAILIG